MKKPVVFFDEVPWIAYKNQDFLEALGHWWNKLAHRKKYYHCDLRSAASWMIEHIVNAKGGLHNRITKAITLMPFTLSETSNF